MLGLTGLLGLLMIGASVDMGGIFGDNSSAEPDDDSDQGQGDNSASASGSPLDLIMEPESATPETPAEDEAVPQQPDNEVIFFLSAGESGVLHGDEYNDALNGSDGDDLIGGDDGDDILFGNGGDDELNGDLGDDTLLGGLGDDKLFGHSGDDSMSGGEGNDWMIGGEGDDSLDGAEGDDRLMAGPGDDVVIGGEGSDVVNGNDGNDSLFGVSTGSSVSEIVDDLARDYLNGSAGDDLLVIGADDNAHGGEGADSFVLGDWLGEGEPAVIEDFNAAEDELVVVYDDSVHAAPELGLQADPDDPDSMILTFDGVAVAELLDQTGLDLDQVSLVPASALPFPASAA
jgi:Ca2+-binding RTX toxin-like protein